MNNDYSKQLITKYIYSTYVVHNLRTMRCFHYFVVHNLRCIKYSGRRKMLGLNRDYENGKIILLISLFYCT